MSIAADKLNPNIVDLAGDRQPDNREENGVSNVPQFPNVIGARNYAGRIFRGDASQPLASQWAHMTNCRPNAPAPACANVPVAFMPTGGTGNNSSPHADSREMSIDADNNLIEVDDGGVYRRTQPQTNLGDWFSLNGNLQVGEQHSTAYDSLFQGRFQREPGHGHPRPTGGGRPHLGVAAHSGRRRCPRRPLLHTRSVHPVLQLPGPASLQPHDLERSRHGSDFHDHSQNPDWRLARAPASVLHAPGAQPRPR